MLLINGTHRSDIEQSNDVVFLQRHSQNYLLPAIALWSKAQASNSDLIAITQCTFLKRTCKHIKYTYSFFFYNSSNYCHDTSGENLKCLLRFITHVRHSGASKRTQFKYEASGANVLTKNRYLNCTN